MKKNNFFLAIPLLLALFLLASCERDGQPVPAESGGETTTTVAPGDPDGTLTFRSCGAVSTECIVTVTVTAGTPNFTVCGQVYGPNDFCDEDIPCGEAKGRRESYSTSPISFCADHVYHPGFFIFNDNTTGSITVTVTSSGTGSATNITIAANDFEGFEVDASCNVSHCP